MIKYKHIAIGEEAHRKLHEIVEKSNKSTKDFTESIIEFFYRTGHDPEDFKIEGSADAIKRLDKRLISFIRTQEKEKLTPMLEEMAMANRQFQEFFAEAPNKNQLQQIVDNQRKLKELFEEFLKK